MAGSGGKQMVKYGCFGCIGLVAIAVLFAGLVGGMAYLKSRSEAVEKETFSHEPLEGEETVQGPATADGDEATEGHVVLDLAGAEFEIGPAAEGGKLEVQATYDRNSYELIEQFEPDGGSGWSYRVSFRRTGSSLVVALKELISGNRPELTILLPPDLSIRLDLGLAEGGARVELGGMWITDATIEMEKGGLELRVSDPMPIPMERLAIHGKMGGLAATKLGNASPRELELDFRMGGMSVDLRGEWRADAQITIHASMGGGVLRLPRNVRIEGLDTRRGVGSMDEEEVPLPTLSFAAESELGELQIME